MAIALESPAIQYKTVDEVAVQLRLSRIAVLGAIHRGKLPAVRLGKEYRIPAQALDAALSVAPGAPRV